MYQSQTLDNKLRVITVPLKETKAVTVLVIAKVGSRYETGNIRGISHFLEHMSFKGTNKRPTALSISKELDSVGAEFNAYTSKDHTAYYIKADARHIDLALDLLSDMLFNSKLDAKEVERERGVIIEEMNMYYDNPLIYIEDLFEESIFKGNPLGQDIIGNKKTIEGMDREKITSFVNKYYTNSNLVIGIAGSIDDKIINKVNKYFKSKNFGKGEYEFKKFASEQARPQVKIMHKDSQQIQIGMGFPAYGYGHKNTYAFQLLSVILGGNMSSRLFVSVRERKGLCYYIKCQPNIYEDTGNLYIQSGLDKNRLDEAINIILEELKKVKQNGVTGPELQRAKDYIKGKTILNLEDSSHVCEWYVKQMVLQKKLLTPEEKFKLYERVNKDDILRVAKNIIQSNKINLAVIGPYHSGKQFIDLLKI